MNFFKVCVQNAADGTRLSHPFFEMSLAHATHTPLRTYGKADLVMGVRPEDIQPCTREGAVLSRRVQVVEPQGSHQIVAMRLDDQIVKVVLPPSPKVTPGELLHTTFRPERLHFFDKDSEARL